jgi:hypothetical protein
MAVSPAGTEVFVTADSYGRTGYDYATVAYPRPRARCCLSLRAPTQTLGGRQPLYPSACRSGGW